MTATPHEAKFSAAAFRQTWGLYQNYFDALGWKISLEDQGHQVSQPYLKMLDGWYVDSD
jgi:hypothetical protein